MSTSITAPHAVVLPATKPVFSSRKRRNGRQRPSKAEALILSSLPLTKEWCASAHTPHFYTEKAGDQRARPKEKTKREKESYELKRRRKQSENTSFFSSLHSLKRSSLWLGGQGRIFGRNQHVRAEHFSSTQRETRVDCS
ncbi:hypothetical protein BHE74_00008453 [Ensete ventricosum]|nr:hypothetical protein GW17_00005125 [Ensete ventricosum]RWW83050.1 hypothetical protein BHE74_00008453 [Ensete ventricosum]RZR93487.1 hypothetical protein BHM03_00022002 [Ensete ventricosum]